MTRTPIYDDDRMQQIECVWLKNVRSDRSQS
jgi:hypothetical protein